MEIDKERILNTIKIIQEYIDLIKKRNISIADESENDKNFRYMGISMAFFTILNKTIELAEELVDSLELKYVATTYMENIEILYKNKLLDENQYKIFKSFVSYRNEIAHEYEEIKNVEIDWCLKNLDFISDFIKIIKKKLLK